MLYQVDTQQFPQLDNHPYQDFINTYTELFARFEHDENARALLNDVAAEMLTSFTRKDSSPTSEEARRYFLWLLSKKGFNFQGSFWRDVDLSRHQCDYQHVMHVALDDVDHTTDPRFATDPRKSMADNILFKQVMHGLDEAEQRLVQARIEGRTLQEIGRKINMTPQGVKKRLDKIYSQVRSRFAPGALQGVVHGP